MVAERAPVGPVPKVGPDGRQLRACGAVRVSSGRQQDGHSPELQRAAILTRGRADGYAITEDDLFEDTASGHKLTRTGYTALLEAVRARTYHAIYVMAFDRFGRDSIERQLRGRELDRLNVPLVSVTEGRDEAGLIRVIRAQMSEEESRKIATRVTPSREAAARNGTHTGRTPYGFTRRYPEHGSGRRPAGTLVPKEPEAGIVQEIFTRYASGRWSTRDLAKDLNERQVPAPGTQASIAKKKEPACWTSEAICRVLRNVSYVGSVTYGAKPQGRFERAAPGSAFTTEDAHAGLVTREVFDRVQYRLHDGRSYTRIRNGKAETIMTRAGAGKPLLAGLLVCHECSGPMDVLAARTYRDGEARCHARASAGTCQAASYRLSLAEEAVLREIGRLRGAPWTLEAEERLAGPDAAVVACLAAELEALRARLTRATRRFTVEIDEPTTEEREAFAQVRAELGSQIAAREHELAQVAAGAEALPRLRALHKKLGQTELGPLCERLRAQGNTVALRDLLTELVDHATLAERFPERRSTWLRLEVTWTPDVATLVQHGLLVLDPPAPHMV
jgi:DNA invertase Pin-like site-specific DNA recombinase